MPDVQGRIERASQRGARRRSPRPSDAATLEELRVRYLGRKAELTGILRGIGELPAERARAGRHGGQRGTARRWRRQLEAARRGARGRRARAGAGAPTRWTSPCPGTPAAPVGSRNLLIRTMREIEDVFVGLGYRVMEGPEVELDYYNFTALNHPPGHPARMAQDTFYVDPETLDPELRIEPAPTAPASRSPGRALPPGPGGRACCAPTPRRCRCGRWRRRSRRSSSSCPAAAIAATRSTPPTARSSTRSRGWRSARASPWPTSRGPSTSSRGRCSGPSARRASGPASSRSPSRASRWTSRAFAAVARGSSRTARATRSARAPAGSRSSARGWWTRTCSASSEADGYDPERVQGFAFGMGIERIAMLKHGVPDLRKFFENDVRVLEQFR